MAALRRPSNYARYRLSPTQQTAIAQVAQALPPPQRHSFRLRLNNVLQISAQPPGFCSDVLVQRAIKRALDEVGAAA